MRTYNGKPLINSVNGKDEVMDAVFPLATRYGGVVVALCAGRERHPGTAEGRFAIARRIYAKAASYGIAAKDIIIDGLAMTISSDNRRHWPRWRRCDASGMNWAVIRSWVYPIFPLDFRPDRISTRHSLHHGHAERPERRHHQPQLRGYDAGVFQLPCAGGAGRKLPGRCLARYAGQTTAAPAAAKGDLPLQECIRKGLKEQTAAATAALLKTTAPLDVINQELIPALDVVGKGFEKGTVFLPQLLMSAEAAKAAFDVIKQQMADSGVVQEKKGKIILATVKGDIHDIGKNIVKVLLENYSYDVIDLGRDVPPETIVETALAQQVKLVGLSALMTTTVPSMEETIRQLNAADPTIKVMVGGAVLTQEYADTIHADAYCKDAMASVNYAGQVLGRKEGQGV